MHEKKQQETGIVVAEEAVHTHTQAIEKLLAGFGYGDLNQVSEALSLLGVTPELHELSERVKQTLETFHKSVWSVKNGLDPATITMTTTNIPDAAKKLQYVLSATNEATHRLFGLVERQELSIARTEAALEALENKIASGADPVSAVAAFSKEFKKQTKEVSNTLSEMVMTQEFQDLCGQALKKVLTLVQGMEGDLRILLKQLGIELKDVHVETPDDTKITEQQTVDDVLKDFGF